jgi:GTP pyrophosphokinase
VELEDLAFRGALSEAARRDQPLVGEHARSATPAGSRSPSGSGGDLRSAKIKAEVSGRPKHLYSIYQKMIARGRDFSEIYDLVGVRVLVDTVRDCYAALGIIHANWQPVPGRFKDYIAMPKFNMYQSLHTTVIGPNGKPVEMQIRTYAMHRTAEYGIAAHWRYKESKNATIVGPPAHIDEMTWLRQLLDWQREAADPAEFLTRCGSTCPRRRCTSSRPRATSSRCPRTRRRSTSPTPCTPRSGTSASAPR